VHPRGSVRARAYAVNDDDALCYTTAMENYAFSTDDMPDEAVTCDVCGGRIPLGADYAYIDAADAFGNIIGSVIAHEECAAALDAEDVAAILGAAVGTDEETLDEVLPLERCCLCGVPIGEQDYLNLIEPMIPEETDGALVATSFHLACYRDDPDGVQRALDDEVMKQRARRIART